MSRFSQIPKAKIPRSSFDLSFAHKTTFDAGLLVPVYVQEVLPGDSFNCKVNLFARLTTPLSVPIMDDMFIDMQFWFVPNRLVWDNWQRFNGEQKNPGDSTDFLVPVVKAGLYDNEVDLTTPRQVGDLLDYFGIPFKVDENPPGTGLTVDVNALPLRAYNLIWNEWYRDQNLQDSIPVPLGDGPDFDYADADEVFEENPYVVRRRGKRHDYFTSCLPFPQKGPGVELPLGATAPVVGNGMTLGLTDGTNNLGMYGLNQDEDPLVWRQSFFGTPIGTAPTGNEAISTGSLGVTDNPEKSGLVTDLSQATAATINSLRIAIALQQLYEADARGGTRYTEILNAHFGVVSPDARLQRPEYLNGFSTPITINTVSQTSSSDGATPQANLAAWAAVGASQRGFTKSFVEHGFILGLASVRARYTYQQGINRMWSRRERFDHYWPKLAHLGEQAVLNKEIYAFLPADGSATGRDGVFGYQERWAEYYYQSSMISGHFRSTAPQSLDIWHLAQNFENLPQLSEEFIEENPPIDRVIAVGSETGAPQFLCDLYFQQRVARVMPIYSVPGLNRI